MNSNRQKNPLRFVFVVLVLYGLLGVFSLCRLLISSGLSYIITEEPNLIVLFLIMILFVFCYFKKSIWAFWAAASVFPIITFYTYIKNSPDKRGWTALIVFNVLIFGYLCSKLEDYINFIKGDMSPKEEDGDKIIENNDSNKNAIKSFNFLLWGAIGAIVFNIYRLYNVSQLSEGFNGVFQTGLRDITTIILAVIFIFLFYKKNILSWWMIPISGPLAWISHYLQHPFELGPFLITLVVEILVCFFVIYKYEDYKLFLKGKKKIPYMTTNTKNTGRE
jgi:hypothetical protein